MKPEEACRGAIARIGVGVRVATSEGSHGLTVRYRKSWIRARRAIGLYKLNCTVGLYMCLCVYLLLYVCGCTYCCMYG